MMTREQVLINHIQEYLDSGMWQYEACYLNKDDLKVIIKALEHQKVGKWEDNDLADYIKDGTPLPDNELENPFNDSRFGG